VAVATDREYGLFIGGEASQPASGDVRALTESATRENVIVSTGARQINPFGL
jgi:hypothetical protein